MTSRTSAIVSPTSAMRSARRSAKPTIPPTMALTHSAPARVLPAPRPPTMSQVGQGWSAARIGGYWLFRLRNVQPS
jgi:hypothetical protein